MHRDARESTKSFLDTRRAHFGQPAGMHAGATLQEEDEEKPKDPVHVQRNDRPELGGFVSEKATLENTSTVVCVHSTPFFCMRTAASVGQHTHKLRLDQKRHGGGDVAILRMS